ncbi:hypothetical protein AKJ64_00375 [candidate division MSBL1 archaeon SCGC-AAA259E17]|uniref:Cobalt ABC transporter permease n=1 Tax=candidate division MSBL1 archaeon SCGC-AAA259E17 TaxID=1698263 RepID=A0A133UGZ8_9EURY|nr:hypothetical protein AKJ64_00375 [candidate division MSBL1 archaeon SCGC-AAA259E17]
MKRPEIDKYASRDSQIHRFDPRAKLISFLLLIFSTVLLPNLKLALLGLTVSVFLLAASKIPPHFVLGHLKWVLFFILPFLVIMPLTVKGAPVLEIGAVEISMEGIRFGSLVAVRALSAVILVFPMVGTMKFTETLKALEELKVPTFLVQMLMFTYRYIFTFLNQFSTMRRAMNSRGFKLEANLGSLKTLGRAIGMLFVRSCERSKRVYQAMLSTGYTGHPKTLTEFELNNRDWIMAGTLLSFAFTLHILPRVVL